MADFFKEIKYVIKDSTFKNVNALNAKIYHQIHILTLEFFSPHNIKHTALLSNESEEKNLIKNLN